MMMMFVMISTMLCGRKKVSTLSQSVDRYGIVKTVNCSKQIVFCSSEQKTICFEQLTVFIIPVYDKV